MIHLLPLLTLAPSAFTPMTMHTVVDDRGVHGVAFRYLAPQGWKTTAVLNWTPNGYSPTELFLSAASPDDRFGFGIVSSLDFLFSGHGASQYAGGYQNGTPPPRVLSDFLLQYAKTLLPKAQLEVTKRVDTPLTGAALPYKRSFGMVSELHLAFTDDKGRSCTGAVAARCDGFVDQRDGGMGAIYSGDWRVENLVFVGGPKGEEAKAMRFFALSAPTVTATRDFAALRYAYVDMLTQNLIAQTKAMLEAGQKRYQATQEQFAKGNAQWREHEAATDKANRAFCDHIGDVERYRGANGEEIKAASTPGGAWQNAGGAVILSDDPHYDPNRPGSIGWSRLQRAH